MFNSIQKKFLNHPNLLLTLYGRNALYLGLRSLRLVDNIQDNILVPSYSCGDEIHAVLEAGYKVKPYHVNRNLKIDISDVISKIDFRTKGILITHFLGFYQSEILLLKDVCLNNNITLIEDCAHITTDLSNNIGKLGDISIFSLRKTLDIFHGGALLINNNYVDLPKVNYPNKKVVNLDMSIFRGLKSGDIKHGTSIENLLKETTNTKNLHGPRHSKFGGYNLGISEEAIFYIKNKINIKKIIKQRVKNFNYYLSFFKKNYPECLFIESINEMDCPLFFPIIVDNSEKICDSLRSKNIYDLRPFWSHKHKYFSFDTDALWLKNKVVVLPLLSVISISDLKNILKIIKEKKGV